MSETKCGWLIRLLFGESPEEYFERHPDAAYFVNRDGRTFANPKRINERIQAMQGKADGRS